MISSLQEAIGLSGGEKKQREVISAIEQKEIVLPSEVFVSEGKLNLYPEVLVKDIVRVYLKKKQLKLQAGNYVGVIPLNEDFAVKIYPKAPIFNIDRMIRVANGLPHHLTGWVSEYAPDDPLSFDLFKYLIDLLVSALDVIKVEGLYKKDCLFRNTSAYPKGRVDVANTVKTIWARGRRGEVISSWVDKSADNPVNRCIKYALWLIAEKVRRLATNGWERDLSRINNSYNSFLGVSFDQDLQFLFDYEVRDPEELGFGRQAYITALKVSKLLIFKGGVSVGREGSDFSSQSFLFSLSEIFENYFYRVLANSSILKENGVSVLDGGKFGSGGAKTCLFDMEGRGGGNVTLMKSLEKSIATPDVVVQKGDGDKAERLILEVKYKNALPLVDRAGINQAVTYGVRYDAKKVVLVHPVSDDRKSLAGGLHRLGVVKDIELFQLAVDLSREDIVEMEKELCNYVCSLL
ncbi:MULTISPECIES: 5-methylcytosine restriction system specificity protein McrC [Halomonas]|uniref:McrBC 5-methylcytosine restriction system component n=1 Tax=Halomonas halophila TaxID=29573 RepID=A0ABQ0U338_9GAMM|nr:MULTISPECIES: hypothetical protein [Halomonas]MDR5889832.1 hypothetical protein [Halomonas salina]WJY06765.1 hypothetical protein QWG60_13855 [Halomonas halophila]GEK72860.1 hypothetical protein HHA04nite_14040 [Halomonas halophila]